MVASEEIMCRVLGGNLVVESDLLYIVEETTGLLGNEAWSGGRVVEIPFFA